MKTRLTFLLVAICLLGVQAKTLLDCPDEIFIYNRQNKVWTFPAVEPGGCVTVEFRHRIDFTKPVGWRPCWQIEVNGRRLTAMGSRTATRLLNKPYYWTHKTFGPYPADNKSDKWYSLYQQDYHATDTEFSPENPEATHVVIDITDVVNTDAPNEICIRFGGVDVSFYREHKIFDRNPSLAVKEFKVSRFRQRSNLKPLPRTEHGRVAVKKLSLPEYQLVSENEKLLLKMAGGQWEIVSRFTTPGVAGKWVEMGGKMQILTPFYKVDRKTVKRENRIDVFDTFTSISDKLIGLKYQYGAALGQFEPVYLAGDASPSSAEYASGRNPTVFASLPEKNMGVGFVAVDDVARVQNVARCDDKFFCIGSDNFALSPGESRTVEWSLYPVASPDYFDFINTVRRDWKVNFPIKENFNLSMIGYASWSKEEAQSFTKNRGLTASTFSVHLFEYMWRDNPEYKKWIGYIWGVGADGDSVRILLNDGKGFKETVADPKPVHDFERRLIAKAREYTPGLKVLTYVHNQLSSSADDAQYEECRLIDENGKGKNYYPGQGKLGKIFVPTLTNAYGKRFLNLIDWYFANFDLDGLYMDETNHCTTRLYYGDKMWDGVSVELDENNNVKRKISFVPLLKLKFTLACLDKILNQHKKILVGNFSPETRSELQYHYPRFEETYQTRWVALSHLYTPLRLGDMLTYANTPLDMAKDIRNALFEGALYYHYLGDTGCPTITSKMYPFTPIELHSGWLMGEERILTALSGDFGWHGRNVLAQTFVYDEKGREVQGYDATTVFSADGTRVKLNLAKDHCAAIVALPVQATAEGDVSLNKIEYADNVLKCKAAGQGKLTLRAGERSKTVVVNGNVDIEF